MNKVHEHPIQTIFALMQSVLVVSGSLVTAGLMKARGFPDPTLSWHSFPIFVRSSGFFFLLIPLGWVLFSLWLESSPSHHCSRKWSLLTGFLILIALMSLFIVSATLASGAGTIIQSTGIESSFITPNA
jgi:hypothetical protein